MLILNEEQRRSALNINLNGSSLFSLIESASKNYDIEIIDSDFVSKNLPRRERNIHKYNCGKLSMVCGSFGMAGAAYLAAKAAYRCGCGLVSFVLPQSIYPIVAPLIPEAVFTPLSECDHISPKHTDLILNSLNKSNCLLLGCGISFNPDTEAAVNKIIKSANLPMVIDADGINCIANSIEILEQTDAIKILTPHHGEMAKLLGVEAKDIGADFINIAGKFAKEHNVILVLKGAYTAVATPNGKIYLNFLAGNSGMAVAGSGDMLAGMIGAFVAEGISPEIAAAIAVYLHALAGDSAAEKLSKRSIMPTDMIEELPCLFKSFE